MIWMGLPSKVLCFRPCSSKHHLSQRWLTMALHRNSIKFQAFKNILKLSLFGVQHISQHISTLISTRPMVPSKKTAKRGEPGPTGPKLPGPQSTKPKGDEARRIDFHVPWPPESIADLTSMRWEIRWDGDLGILTGPTGQSYKPWDRRLGTWGLGPLSAHNSGPGSPRTKVVKVATKTLIHLHIQLGFGMPAASFVSLVISRDQVLLW